MRTVLLFLDCFEAGTGLGDTLRDRLEELDLEFVQMKGRQAGLVRGPGTPKGPPVPVVGTRGAADPVR